MELQFAAPHSNQLSNGACGFDTPLTFGSVDERSTTAPPKAVGFIVDIGHVRARARTLDLQFGRHTLYQCSTQSPLQTQAVTISLVLRRHSHIDDVSWVGRI